MTFEQSLAVACVALWVLIIFGLAVREFTSPKEVQRKPRP